MVDNEYSTNIYKSVNITIETLMKNSFQIILKLKTFVSMLLKNYFF